MIPQEGKGGTSSHVIGIHSLVVMDVVSIQIAFEFKYKPILKVIKCNPKKSLSISLIQFLDMVRVKCFVENFLLSPKRRPCGANFKMMHLLTQSFESSL